MKKSKSTSEWDNPKNIPTLHKKPGVGIREYPSKEKLAGFGHDTAAVALPAKSKKFGRAKSRKMAAAAILAKARKGA